MQGSAIDCGMIRLLDKVAKDSAVRFWRQRLQRREGVIKLFYLFYELLILALAAGANACMAL